MSLTNTTKSSLNPREFTVCADLARNESFLQSRLGCSFYFDVDFAPGSDYWWVFLLKENQKIHIFKNVIYCNWFLVLFFKCYLFMYVFSSELTVVCAQK